MHLHARSLLDAADPAVGGGARSKLARLLPFGLLVVLAFALIPVTGTPVDAGPLIAAGAVLAAIAAVTVLVPWESVDRRLRLAPALGVLVVVMLLRQAEGGVGAAIGVLPLVPVLWAALYGTARGLALSVVCVAATFVVPILTIGGSKYPGTEWARAALWTLGALLIGAAVQRLVLTIHRQREALERLARTDSLTGLLNHRAWQEALEHEIARARRSGERLALAMIDLDRLKQINDTHGHEAGSAAIKAAAAAWQDSIRAGDVLARFGGDEFGLVLLDAGESDALVVAERLRAATPAPSTCSVGVATWDGEEDGRELFIRADLALYEAKRGGRDRVVSARAGRAATA